MGISRQLGVVIFLILSTSTWAASLQLINDTNVDLTASIYAADKTLLEKRVIKRQSSIAWDRSIVGFSAPSGSETPYTVEWFCVGDNSTSYSMNDPVGPGSTVIASQGVGPRSCPAKKKKDSSNEEEPSSSQQLNQMRKEAGPPKGILQ